MTTPYTPKIGDILTGVDARGVRGPAEVVRVNKHAGFAVRFDFSHHSATEQVAPGVVYAITDGGINGLWRVRVLFEPWQEPAAEAGCEACKGRGYLMHEGGDSTASVTEYEDCRDCQPATKVTTIGAIAAEGVKPGTVVAVHLVVVTPSLSETWPLTLRDHGGAFHAPTRDTPCTIISEPEPEPWKAGDEAVWDGKPVTVFAINRDKAWLELSPHANEGPVVPLAELERPQ